MKVEIGGVCYLIGFFPKEKRPLLWVELPPRVHARLDELRALVEAESTIEIVRRALAVYDVLVVATRRDGGRVILRCSDGAEREIKIP